jgi:hypothetical protein
MITIPIPALITLAILVAALLFLLYMQMRMIRNGDKLIAILQQRCASDDKIIGNLNEIINLHTERKAEADGLIASLHKISESKDRLIRLQELQIENAEKRAANFEYLYYLAKNTNFLQTPAETHENQPRQ